MSGGADVTVSTNDGATPAMYAERWEDRNSQSGLNDGRIEESIPCWQDSSKRPKLLRYVALESCAAL
eukprot:3425648-Amphidinium_carterae.1